MPSVTISSVERTKNVISRTVFQAVIAKMATFLLEILASEVRNRVLNSKCKNICTPLLHSGIPTIFYVLLLFIKDK